jgi:tetratricopeptide (TPR) repeat protein
VREAAKPGPLAAAGPLWTDDFSALFPILRWPGVRGGPAKAMVFQAQSAATLAGGTNLAGTIALLREELSRNPDSAMALNNLAVLLATAPEAGLRNGAEAVQLAERACALTANRNPVLLTTLAAAYAEAGRFEEAIQTAQQAIKFAREAAPKSWSSATCSCCSILPPRRALSSAGRRAVTAARPRRKDRAATGRASVPLSTNGPATGVCPAGGVGAGRRQDRNRPASTNGCR